MKGITLVACMVLSCTVLVLSDTGTGYYYAPEYMQYEFPETTQGGVSRSKRGVDPGSLAFLVGVGAGGIFGPILYNRLYGWKPVKGGWQEPQGWGEGGY